MVTSWRTGFAFGLGLEGESVAAAATVATLRALRSSFWLYGRDTQDCA
jgi:hypothetical protein